MQIRRRCLSMTMAGLVLTAGGCASDPVVRKVSLEPQPMVPAGSATLVGSEVRVSFMAAEPLAEGSHHHLWVDTPTAFVPVGAIEPGTELAVDPAASGFALEDATAAFVTEETEEAPADPSATTVVRGPVPGALLFGGTLAAHDFEDASGSAVLEDESIDVDVSGLPALPRGFRYGVWLGFGGEAPDSPPAGDGHMHMHSYSLASAGHDADHDHDLELTHVGDLEGGSLSASTGSTLVTATECRVTIESDHGVDEISTALVLTGTVTTTASAGSTGEPAGGGHAAHMH